MPGLTKRCRSNTRRPDGGGWSRSADGRFTAVTPNMVVGVNDKTNRAAIGGRYSSQFIERHFPSDYFSLRGLTHISD